MHVGRKDTASHCCENANVLLLNRSMLPWWARSGWLCAMPAQRLRVSEQARANTSPSKNSVTSKSPVEDIPVVTLIRTDTTLDHSQKAKTVYCPVHHVHIMCSFSQVSGPWKLLAPRAQDSSHCPPPSLRMLHDWAAASVAISNATPAAKPIGCARRHWS
jgi:hypothetical protein